jgi:hypothetical protein
MTVQPDPYARWVSSLHCGHQARTRGRPRPGQWITCPDGRCQGQRRVDAVAAVPVVLVQDPLFGLEALT